MRQVKKKTIDNLIALIIAQHEVFHIAEKRGDTDLWNKYIETEREAARKIARQIEPKKTDILFLSMHINDLIESALILHPIKKMNHSEIYEMLKCFDIEVVEEQSNDG